jgi:hypothetical protein
MLQLQSAAAAAAAADLLFSIFVEVVAVVEARHDVVSVVAAAVSAEFFK